MTNRDLEKLEFFNYFITSFIFLNAWWSSIGFDPIKEVASGLSDTISNIAENEISTTAEKKGIEAYDIIITATLIGGIILAFLFSGWLGLVAILLAQLAGMFYQQFPLSVLLMGLSWLCLFIGQGPLCRSSRPI